MTINYRKTTTSDWKYIQELNAEVYENSRQFDQYLKENDCYSDESELEYKKSVIDPDKFCMIAEIDNVPIGYLYGGENNYSWRVNKRGEIFHMGVSPTYRLHGVGTQLISLFKNWCKDRGLSHIAATTYFTDNKAKNFYSKQGMAPIDIGFEGKLE